MSIEIFLDNSNNVCFPGQTISGRVECTFNTEKNLRAIKVRFRGRSKTAWTESEHYRDHSNKSQRRSVHYYAEEIYMDAEYNLVAGGENFSVPAGKHVYPFSFILPPQLPSPFEGSEGNIRYYVKAVVDRPWKFDYESRVPLNVTSLIDLNLIPGLREPVAISDDKTMCSCWCNDSGALTCNLSMPVTGYVPGQEINIGCSIQNLTNVTVESVKFKFMANYEYISHYPRMHTRYDYNEIGRCEEGGVGAHGEKSWTSTLVVPTNQFYPNLIPCSIINVYYSVRAEVIVPCPHTNLELEFPITIGSVALSGVNTAVPGPPLPGGQFAVPNDNTPLLNPGLPGYPPPTISNGSYPEKYPGGVPPPYRSGGGEGGSTPYAPMGGPSPYPPGATAPPPGVVPSYPPSVGGLSPYPPPTGGSVPYPPPTGGSVPYPTPTGGSAPYSPPTGGSASYPPPIGGPAPYPPPTGGSAPYPPPTGGSAPYPPSTGGSTSYPPPTGGSSSYPPEKTGWSEPNPKDATASAPPPSYEESLPQEKK